MTAEKENPDLMVLDVMLPDGDGFSLMKQLRTFTNVPIIFLTSKGRSSRQVGRILGLVQTITFQSRLCRRSYYCVSMRFCAEPIKRIQPAGFPGWMYD